ncbi:MAG: hypothetical protein K2I67_02030, partial [Malacoplasma sp.]|nr:hypothetical protein [Malacoplasma sp.]
MKKNKIILKSIFSTIGLVSISIPFALTNKNEIYFSNNSIKNQADAEYLNNKVLSDDVQDVNQTTQNGFIGKTTSTVFSSNFYGELLWSYDLTTSKFLLNSDGTQKSINNFIVKYNANNNTVAVAGNYSKNNNDNQSFFFQLYADTGLPYFSNESPNLSEQEKYDESVITSEKNLNLIKNPSTIIFDGNYATIFNESVLSEAENNKPSQINVLTLDVIQLTFDDSFFTGIKTDYTSDVFLGASFLDDGNILVTTGDIDSQTQKLRHVRAFVLTNTLKSIIITDSNGNRTSSRLTLVDNVSNSSFLPSNTYSSNEVIRDILITDSGSNTSKITYIFIGKKSVFRSISYNKSTYVLTTLNTSNLTNQGGSISYLTEDKVNKKIYYTTTTVGKELMGFDVSNYSFETLSSDQSFSGAKIASFLPTSTSSQLIINKNNGNQQEIYGFQTSIGGNAKGKVEIKVPQINDYVETAKENGLYNKLPSDITADDATKVLKIKNYNSNDYTVSLLQNTLIQNDDTGFVSFALNLSINQWWDKAHPGNFESTRNISLTGLPSISSQKFQLVTNASIDSSKYAKVYELQQNIYLSSLTKQDILDYFISYGNGLKFSESDISLNGDNSSAQIKAAIDNNSGILTISYEISANQNKTSLNEEYKSGTKTWQFNKRLDNYKKLQLSNVLIDSLKYGKYAGDVSLDDLVSSIDFVISGTGYSTNISNWKWTPTYPIGSSDWINQQLNGVLSGTLQYIRSSEDPPALLVPDSNFTLEINQAGFRKLSLFILGDDVNNRPISFNQTLADSLTVTSNKQEAISNLKEIITQTVSTTNSWVPSNQISYSVDEFNSTNTELFVNINIAQNAETNISIGDMSNIKLDNNWIQELKKISSNLFEPIKIKLNISIATYSWNIAKANETSTITMDDINSKQLNTYRHKLPSAFVNDVSSNSDNFQKITNLLNQSNDLNYKKYYSLQKTDSSNDIGDFIIQSIQLTPNDETGTITANYTLIYPN